MKNKKMRLGNTPPKKKITNLPNTVLHSRQQTTNNKPDLEAVRKANLWTSKRYVRSDNAFTNANMD